MPEPTVRTFCRGILCIGWEAICGLVRCMVAMLLALIWAPMDRDVKGLFLEAAMVGGFYYAAADAVRHLLFEEEEEEEEFGAPTKQRKVCT